MPTKKSAPRRPQKNLWPRRIITGTGLVLIIALIVWLIWSIVAALFGSNADEAAPSSAGEFGTQSAVVSPQSGPRQDSSGYELESSEELTRDGILDDATGQVRQPECLQADLSYSSSAINGLVGSEQSFNVTVHNSGKTACLTTLESLNLSVRTGDQLVYDSAQCTDQLAWKSKKLLLSPGREWSGSIAWDGKVYEDGCSTPDGGAPNAEAGTYRGQLVVKSVMTGEEMVFVIDEPAPEE
ncbi:hypothetical protein [Schaalia vaccimaxillae]|uniref:hypothetical protein n=1 Tax=Schaalia vaccimaxillae TaxID=183916 RepID=UPI0003B4E110|nr:hypothetical protein [Schaalia vaccimaxillae]